MGCSTSALRREHTDRKDLCASWQLIGTLGEGSFAHVHSAKYKRSGRVEAVKVFGQSQYKDAAKEAHIWKMVGKHDHVVSLIDTYQTNGRFCMVMEKCECSLWDFVSETGVNEMDIARMTSQMLAAIAHVHSRGIVHRDIKPDNVLYGRRNDKILKLCDFGLSAIVPRSGKLFGSCGTPMFMSPEMIGPGPHSFKTDVWSLGVVVYLMLYGRFPYASISVNSRAVKKAILDGSELPSFTGPRPNTAQATEFTVALLDRNMSSRISAEDARDLPFLEGVRHLPIQRIASEPCPQKTHDVNSSEPLVVNKRFSEPVTHVLTIGTSDSTLADEKDTDSLCDSTEKESSQHSMYLLLDMASEKIVSPDSSKTSISKFSL